MKTIIAYYLFLLFSAFTVISFNTPNDIQNNLFLFKIQRSKDANEIYYEKNLKGGNLLNTDAPINIYWMKPGDKGKKEELSWAQKKYAYGLKYTKINNLEAVFNFVSYKDRDFILKKDKRGTFRVFTISNNKEIVVNRIFLQIDGGTLWFPTITRIDIYGINHSTNKPVKEIVHL